MNVEPPETLVIIESIVYKSNGFAIAVVIGINQYQNGIAKLKTAKPDAEELANLLRDEYQYQVELIIDGDNSERKPTLKELENLLTKWVPEKLQPPAENNRPLFYFAGHGMPLESDHGSTGKLKKLSDRLLT